LPETETIEANAYGAWIDDLYGRPQSRDAFLRKITDENQGHVPIAAVDRASFYGAHGRVNGVTQLVSLPV
jgi:hypothetical protein